MGGPKNKTGEAGGANPQPDDMLDLRGGLAPFPANRRVRVAQIAPGRDTHDPTKEIVYSGTPLMEVLKAGGLLLDSGMAGIRETVTMAVLVEAADRYRAVFSLVELDPELTDRLILLADTKDGQPLPPREGSFRIIVPSDKRPARRVRQVRAVTVRKN